MAESKFGTNAKVGIFVVITIIVLLWMTFQLERWGKVAGYPLYSTFRTAIGVNKETSVFIAGIKVGEVGDIQLSQGMARLTLKIFPQYKIEQDAVAIIRQKGLLGEKFIEIKPGTPGGPYLQSGEEILRTESPPDYEELITDLGLVADNLKSISDRLLAMLERNDRKIDLAIENLVTVTESLSKDMPSIMSDLRLSMESIRESIISNRAAIDDTMVKVDSVMEKLDKSMESISNIVARIEEGKGTIGKLVNDDETVNRLNDAITGIQEYITTAKKLEFYIDYRGEYEAGKRFENNVSSNFEGIGMKSYLNLRLHPRPDKFYMLGIVSDPERVLTVKDITTTTENGNVSVERIHEEIVEDKLKFNAQIGKRVSFVTFRGGVIESTGGVGVDLYLPKDLGTVSFEAFDFSKDTNPYLKAWLSMNFLRYFFVAGGLNDFINYKLGPTYFLGGGISFKDEDLKSILGIAGTAAYVGSASQ
jgi:phospholipid/cholesterol/gamma-HCH transport system substrate-binding protein